MGDLLFASGGQIGLTYFKSDNSPIYVQGGAVLYVRTSESNTLDGGYLNYAFHSATVKQYIDSTTIGTALRHFTLKPAINIPICYPDLTEQQKISLIFRVLDNTIALQQEKLDLLKQLKRGYLQKLFPVGSAKQPELRFAGFDGDWVQRKLSSLTVNHNSGVYISKDQYGEGTNIIGVGDIYDSDVVDGRMFRLAPVNDKAYILHSGDLLYGESSLVPEGIARVVSVSNKGEGTAFAWHTRRFKVESDILNSHFLSLELDYWRPARSHLMRSATKTALTGITTQDFFSTHIVYPSLSEQELISKLISSLDNTIALQQQKLDALTKLKQAYLQKLFV